MNNLNPLYESMKQTAGGAVKKALTSPFESFMAKQALERHIAEQPMIGSLMDSNGKGILINLGKLGNFEVRELRAKIHNLQHELSKTVDPRAIERLKSNIEVLNNRLVALNK